MNILSKKMMLFGIALFVMQNVCAMWNFGSLSLTGRDVAAEEYIQELEALQRAEELQESRYSRNFVNSPEMSRKQPNKTLARTSRTKRGAENNTPPSNTK